MLQMHTGSVQFRFNKHGTWHSRNFVVKVNLVCDQQVSGVKVKLVFLFAEANY